MLTEEAPKGEAFPVASSDRSDQASMFLAQSQSSERCYSRPAVGRLPGPLPRLLQGRCDPAGPQRKGKASTEEAPIKRGMTASEHG